MTAVEWKAGMAARVVEHNPETFEPVPGGETHPAVIEHSGDTYVLARLADGALWTFYQGTGWPATSPQGKWRLLPGTGENEGTPGDTILGAGVYDAGLKATSLVKKTTGRNGNDD